jgi:hypothetical protein
MIYLVCLFVYSCTSNFSAIWPSYRTLKCLPTTLNSTTISVVYRLVVEQADCGNVQYLSIYSPIPYIYAFMYVDTMYLLQRKSF